MGVPVSPRSDRRFPRRAASLDRDLRSPALAYVEPPPALGRVAVGLAGVFLLLAAVLLIMPWRQAAVGSGRVIAYSPADRQQRVEAPIDGRLLAWRVSEGSRVQAGDVLVELVDNDIELMGRLNAQYEAMLRERGGVEAQAASYRAKVDALQAQLARVGAEYTSKLAEIEQKRIQDQAKLETARLNLDRVAVLADEGIASTRQRELAELDQRTADASLEARQAELEAVRQARGKVLAETETKLASAQAELEAANVKLAELDGKLLDLDVKRSRQAQQRVTAPRDGVVLRLYGGPGGGQVKKGDPLLTLVPETSSRAVELWLDGNDVPLVRSGESTRLVFEGWPALQVVGLPGASEGTFGGRVDFVDATDDGSGTFRVVVVPDPDQPPWPEGQALRQGVRAKGWVLLGQVSLGYELWRQLNGFPALPPVEKGSSPTLPSAKKPKAPKGLSP